MGKEELHPERESIARQLVTRRTALGVIGVGVLGTVYINANSAISPSLTPGPMSSELSLSPSQTIPATKTALEPSLNPTSSAPAESAERISGIIYPGDVIFSVPEKRKKAFITVDDCNSRPVIRQWLKVGREKNAAFTFFPTGISAEQDYDLFIQALEEGHEIGIHSRSHPDLAKPPFWRVKEQIGSNLKSIKDEVSREEPVNLLRLPYGSGTRDREVRRAAKYFNLAIVQWNNSSVDTFLPTGDEAGDVRRIVKNLEDVRGGDIVLFHANFRHSPAAAREVLDIMKSKGLTADKLSDNLQLSPEVGQPPGT